MRIANANAVSQLTIARLLGVSAMTLRNWGEKGCPRNLDNTYSIREVFTWRLAVESAKADGADSDSPELEKWRKARRELAELELSERRGLVVNIAHVRTGVSRTMNTLKTNLQRLPTKCAATLAALDRPEDVCEEMTREVREQLEDTRRGLLELAGTAPTRDELVQAVGPGHNTELAPGELPHD